MLAYLDEFGTIGHIPEFPSRLATVRSARIGCLLVVQDRAQLVKAYGAEDADTILTNATTKLCLARVTHDDAEYFSKLVGTTTAHATNRGSTRPLLLPWADRGSRGVGEVARPLITPDELTTLGDAVLMAGGGHRPIRARQRRYYQDRALRVCVPGPADPDPLAPFRERRRRALLPTPDLAVPLPAPGFADEVGGSSIVEGWAGADGEQFVPGGIGATAVPEGSTELSNPVAWGRRGDDGSDPASTAAPRSALTAGERRVLEALAATGHPGTEVSSAELAALLGIASSTVRDALTKIRRKLGVDGTGDLVRVARERGLFDGGAGPSEQ